MPHRLVTQSTLHTFINHLDFNSVNFSIYFYGILKYYQEHNFTTAFCLLYRTGPGELKGIKAPGLDRITSNTLKELKYLISKPLTYIINKIMETGVWPTCFGEGIVKPIFKAGDPLEAVNYRPITLISTLAKVSEKVLKTRIDNFLNKYEILSERQFGFRKARSTQDAIAYLMENVYKTLDQTIPTMCIFVDLAKAFDTVNHRILLNKLEKYGFRGKALSLMETYLQNHTQRVQIGDFISRPEKIQCGVPQGSVLGPILFTIYINDLLMLESKGNIISYADDTVILYKDTSWITLKETAERDFINIKAWLNKNLLSLNFSKTTFLTFSSYPRVTCDRLIIRDEDGEIELNASESVKYLGIIIDKHLKWDLQVNYIIKKIRPLLSKFKFLRQYLDLDHMKALYYSLIRSHLTYGIIGWGGVYKNNLKNLEVMHKWFLKIMLKKVKTYPTDMLYQEAHVLDLRQLFSWTTLTRLYVHNDHINIINYCHNTRQRDNLCRLSKCYKTIGKRCYTYIGQKLYNIIPDNLRNSPSSTAYRCGVKTWLFSLSRHLIHDIIEK